MWSFFLLFISHGIFLLSVFDVFFKSTVHQGLDPIPLNNTCFFTENRSFCLNVRNEVERVVLFVCDGLPAEYLYIWNDYDSTNTPFIRSIIQEEGSWGLSFTRVPTESRPGHVALISGLYEDPSAIFKGWKDNPVAFDSVFNQSDATFAFGCEDILNLFKKRMRYGHIQGVSYPSEWQDYSGKRGTAEKLDTWVHKIFLQFLSDAEIHGDLSRSLRQPRVVLFFHLLGVDVAGHAYKPKTKYYANALKNADKVTKEITFAINNFFNDSRTAFIFTSDHGMTDWGSHGAASEVESLTPIVAWGAGIKKPRKTNASAPKLSTFKVNRQFGRSPAQWKLDGLQRYDMNQADIAVLMSTLLSVPIPVNSMGILPHHILDMPPAQVSLAYFANARQLLRQFEATEEGVRDSLLPFFFRAYEPLAGDRKHIISEIQDSLISHNFTGANSVSDQLIVQSLRGMEYYDTYLQKFLLAHLFLGFFSIGMVIVGKVLNVWSVVDLELAGLTRIKSQKFLIYFIIAVGLGVLSLSLLVDAVPTYYLVYFVVSWLMFLWSVIENPWYTSIFRILFSEGFGSAFLLYFTGAQFFVFVFFERRILSIPMIGLGFWPILSELNQHLSRRQQIKWLLLCIALALFPFLPIVEKKENIFLKFGATIYWLYRSMQNLENTFLYHDLKVIQVQTAGAIFIICNMFGIFMHFTYGVSNLYLHQVTSFLWLGVILTSMMFGATRAHRRFTTISVAVGLAFQMFALSYESFFVIVLASLLSCWIEYESLIFVREIQESYFLPWRYLCKTYVRRTYTYLLLIFISFFGIGNLSSINSFNTDWVKGFTTTFEPFKIMGLMILRTILPIFLVTCAFRFTLLNVRYGSGPVFYLVLLFCELVAAELLLSIQNVGSWLEIGTSLTRFIIMESIVLFLAMLYSFVSFFSSNVRFVRRRSYHFD